MGREGDRTCCRESVPGEWPTGHIDLMISMVYDYYRDMMAEHM